MTFRDLEEGLPGGSSYWIYNPTVVAATGHAYHGLARVSLAVGDGGRCAAAEAEMRGGGGGTRGDGVAVAEAVLFCRKWYVGGFRDVVVQWWAPADAPCDARVVRVLDEGEDPRLYRSGRDVKMTLQRWELLSFLDAGPTFDVVRALYESPINARGGPVDGDVYAVRLVHARGRPDRGCASFDAFRCPAPVGARYETWWLWQRVIYACGASPKAQDRLTHMLANAATNASSVDAANFPSAEDKNWSPFPSYEATGLMLFTFAPFATCAVVRKSATCAECVPVASRHNPRADAACGSAKNRSLALLAARGLPAPDATRCVIHLNGVPLLPWGPVGAALGIAHAVVHLAYAGRNDAEGEIVHASRDYEHFFFLATEDGVTSVSRPLPLRRKISHAPWFDFCDARRDVLADRTARARRAAHPDGECGRNVAFVSGADALPDGGVAVAYGVGDRESRLARYSREDVDALFLP